MSEISRMWFNLIYLINSNRLICMQRIALYSCQNPLSDNFPPFLLSYLLFLYKRLQARAQNQMCICMWRSRCERDVVFVMCEVIDIAILPVNCYRLANRPNQVVHFSHATLLLFCVVGVVLFRSKCKCKWAGQWF